MPNAIRAAPMAMRSHDAQLGGLSRRPPSRSDTSTKMAANAASPTSQPAKNARPVDRGRGLCNTRTAGMIDSGDSATTNASGISSVSTDPQLADIEGPFVVSFDETVAIVAAREGTTARRADRDWQPPWAQENARLRGAHHRARALGPRRLRKISRLERNRLNLDGVEQGDKHFL